MLSKEYSVEGRVAIVTGAGRGIGKAISLTLAEAGADIAVVARTAKQIEETAEEVRKLGRKALAIPTDVTKEDQIKGAVEQTLSQFGKIDILVNNAGIDISRPIAFVPGMKLPGRQWAGDDWDKPLTLKEWHQIIDTNLTSAFLFAQAVGPHLMKRRKGKVINTSSASAKASGPGFCAYCVSKAALSMFTQCLAAEWAQFNICVNAVGPGWIYTDMTAGGLEIPELKKQALDATPLGRLGEPREVALLVVYLASEASNFMTGQTIYIDGGQLASG